MLQLKPSINVKTPNGEGKAIIVINHGTALPLEWLVVNSRTKEFESWRTQDIKPIIMPVPFLEPLQPSFQDAQSSSTTEPSQTLVI